MDDPRPEAGGSGQAIVGRHQHYVEAPGQGNVQTIPMVRFRRRSQAAGSRSRVLTRRTRRERTRRRARLARSARQIPVVLHAPQSGTRLSEEMVWGHDLAVGGQLGGKTQAAGGVQGDLDGSRSVEDDAVRTSPADRASAR